MGPRQIHHVSMTMDGFLLSEGNLKLAFSFRTI
jgi:hypothetical protein